MTDSLHTVQHMFFIAIYVLHAKRGHGKYQYSHCPRQNALLSSYSSVWDLQQDSGKNINSQYLIPHTMFLRMWGLQILLFGLRDSLVWRRSTECQLCKDNEITLVPSCTGTTGTFNSSAENSLLFSAAYANENSASFCSAKYSLLLSGRKMD